jgi:hypothetical protein
MLSPIGARAGASAPSKGSLIRPSQWSDLWPLGRQGHRAGLMCARYQQESRRLADLGVDWGPLMRSWDGPAFAELEGLHYARLELGEAELRRRDGVEWSRVRHTGVMLSCLHPPELRGDYVPLQPPSRRALRGRGLSNVALALVRRLRRTAARPRERSHARRRRASSRAGPGSADSDGDPDPPSRRLLAALTAGTAA